MFFKLWKCVLYIAGLGTFILVKLAGQLYGKFGAVPMKTKTCCIYLPGGTHVATELLTIHSPQTIKYTGNCPNLYSCHLILKRQWVRDTYKMFLPHLMTFSGGIGFPSLWQSLSVTSTEEQPRDNRWCTPVCTWCATLVISRFSSWRVCHYMVGLVHLYQCLCHECTLRNVSVLCLSRQSPITWKVNPFTAPAGQIKKFHTYTPANSIIIWRSYNKPTFNTVNFDRNLITCPCEGEESP